MRQTQIGGGLLNEMGKDGTRCELCDVNNDILRVQDDTPFQLKSNQVTSYCMGAKRGTQIRHVDSKL